MFTFQVEEKQGPVFMVINSAGGALSRSFVDHDAGDFKVNFSRSDFKKGFLRTTLLNHVLTILVF